jgi:hypothetical protein
VMLLRRKFQWALGMLLRLFLYPFAMPGVEIGVMVREFCARSLPVWTRA